MAILEDLTKVAPLPVLVGLGLVVVAPNVIPAVASGLRPLAKVLVKTGLTLFDAVKEGIAEAGEQVNDLVAETRAEMADEETTGAEEDEAETSPRTRRRRSLA